uniref:Uncharacterized protein n=1 Tax=Magnetococcus massalia (strain MO-1) TaxID=451514 RepID=A0A1S7LQP7_MAGMO|nr:Conserved protein of unknown function. Tetratricopeptide TPR_2 repeat protein [Candidatus Magnetococcus massalia]
MENIKPLLVKAIEQLQEQRFEQALAICTPLVSRYPESWELKQIAAVAHQELGQWSEAEELLQKAILQEGQQVNLRIALGRTLQELERPREALLQYEAALQLEPQNPSLTFHIGDALMDMGDPLAASHAFGRAVKLNPKLSEAWINFSLCLQAQGELDTALQALQQCLLQDPNNVTARVDYAITLLHLKRYEEGWNAYTWRYRLPQVSHNLNKFASHSPLWDGRDLAGQSILVLSEQGYGDNIQFIRYLPMLREKGAGEIILETLGPLESLFEHNQLADRSVSITQSPQERPDCFVTLLDLPRLLYPHHPTVPNSMPTLTVEAQLLETWAERVTSLTGEGTPRKVGLIWSGKPLHPRDPARRRSCPWESLEPLANQPGISWFSLQMGLEEIPQQMGDQPLHDLSPHLGDFHQTAAAMLQLDLIITIDTASAHLAASLGCATWMLTPYAPDWRWGQQGPTCDWYPTMRLFRQPSAGDWQGAVTELTRALQQWQEG